MLYTFMNDALNVLQKNVIPQNQLEHRFAPNLKRSFTFD